MSSVDAIGRCSRCGRPASTGGCPSCGTVQYAFDNPSSPTVVIQEPSVTLRPDITVAPYPTTCPPSVTMPSRFWGRVPAFEEEGRKAYRAWCVAQGLQCHWERQSEATRAAWRSVAGALLRGRL